MTTKRTTIRRAVKSHPYIALALIILIVIVSIEGAAMLGLIGAYELGGGSLWQFDYKIKQVKIDPDGLAATTYTSGTTPYTWTMDVDGSYNPQDPNKVGHNPDIQVGFSHVGRVDKNGNSLLPKQDDPNQMSYELNGKTYYQFYYLFDVQIKTMQDAVAYSVEWGSQDVYVTIQVLLEQGPFDTEIDAYYADARIHDLEYTPDPLNYEEVVYFQAAKLDFWDIGNALAFQNIQKVDAGYTADLVLFASLTPGVTWIRIVPAYYGSWDISIIYRVMVCLLLIEPLEIGDPSNIDPFEPPHAFPLWLVLLIITATIIIVLILAFAWAWSRRGNKQQRRR